MAKDHAPGGFDRPSGYKSDLEYAEERGTRINTSFASGNANVYVHNAEHTHEHFWYNPETCSCGYHGENVPTHNNHPADIPSMEGKTGTEEENIMENAGDMAIESECLISFIEEDEVNAAIDNDLGTGEECGDELNTGENCDDELDDGEGCDDDLDL